MSAFQPGRQDSPRIPARPAPRPSRFSALALWALAGAGLVLMSLLSFPLSRAMAGLDAQLQLLIYNLIYYLAFAALPVFLLARRGGGLWRAYRPYPISPLSALSVVALALLGVFLVTDVTALWTILLESLGLNLASAGIDVPASAPGLAVCVLYIAVLPAVCEEFLFRGAILSAFEAEGTRRAVWIAALLFALLHGSVEGFPAQLLVGAILGWLTVYCDSIYAALIYHTTHNAANVLLQFAVNRSVEDAPAAGSRMLEVIGGAPGLVQLLLELALLAVMMLFTLRFFRLTARLRGVAVEPPRRAERMRPGEWALLLLGLAFAGLLFGADIYAGIALGGAA